MLSQLYIRSEISLLVCAHLIINKGKEGKRYVKYVRKERKERMKEGKEGKE